MVRVLLLVTALAFALSSCTSGNAEGIETPSTEPPPLTTLAPAGGDTPTSTVPDDSTEPTTTAPTTTTEPPLNECVVRSDTSVEGSTAACEVLGITVRAGEDVDEAAVDAYADRIYHLLVFRPDLATAIANATLEGRIIPAGSRITTMVEFEDLYDLYPGTDWNRRGRSFAGTDAVPYFAASEENLLCLDDDFYAGEDEAVRSFALTIRRFGLDAVDPATSAVIDQAFGRAIAAGLWENTLAEINSDEYWMEGVQSYFDVNLEDTAEDREPNSSHNAVNTRDELADYDPPLSAIVASVFGDTEWRPACP